jgi:hypothetical protein
MGFNECDNCNQPIIWDKARREQLNTKRPLNRDGTIHTCGGQIQQHQYQPQPHNGQQQKSDDIKAAQLERKRQHVELIKNLQWLTKMLSFKAEQDGGGNAKDILDAMGFEEFREQQRSFEDHMI